jgi:hypothetical protein
MYQPVPGVGVLIMIHAGLNPLHKRTIAVAVAGVAAELAVAFDFGKAVGDVIVARVVDREVSANRKNRGELGAVLFQQQRCKYLDAPFRR